MERLVMRNFGPINELDIEVKNFQVFIGPQSIMQHLSAVNAKINLSSPSVGQYLAADLLRDDSLDFIRDKYLIPHYKERANFAWKLLHSTLPDNIQWRVHSYNGSYFFWLWCEGIKISSGELYERLKARGVIIVSGEYFFAGQDVTKWDHSAKCIRINFARPDHELEAGFTILAQELQKAV